MAGLGTEGEFRIPGSICSTIQLGLAAPPSVQADYADRSITGSTQETAAINQALIARKNELLWGSTQK